MGCPQNPKGFDDLIVAFGLMIQEVALEAVMNSILLRACLAGICHLDGTVHGWIDSSRHCWEGKGYLRVLLEYKKSNIERNTTYIYIYIYK